MQGACDASERSVSGGGGICLGAGGLIFIATPEKTAKAQGQLPKTDEPHCAAPRQASCDFSLLSHHRARVRKSGCKAPRPPAARARPAQGPARAPAQRPAAAAAAPAAAAAAAAGTLGSQPWPSASSRAWSFRRVAPTRSGGRASPSQRCAAETAVRAAGALCCRGGERSACARSGRTLLANRVLQDIKQSIADVDARVFAPLLVAFGPEV